MADTFGSRVKNAWNAFLARDQTMKLTSDEYGMSYSRKPDRVRLSLGNERSIIAALYNRIAIDVASLSVRHVRVDSNGMYVETIESPLNECLTLSPNLDQIARSFFQDLVLSLFDEGCIAVVPIETNSDPNVTGSYDIYQLRVAKIVEWYPTRVLLDAYDERDGQHHEFVMRKDAVAIVENPLYAVMNEPNSTLRRLIRKMNLLDKTDEQASSGKLDILIQLPYTIKSTARQQQAEQRRKLIEEQLAGSKYGIAYIDGTERVTQLNRPAENNLQIQIEYLTKLLFNQLGVTEKIFYGEADETETLNYQNRTIEPIISAITTAMTRSFLTKTARTQGQRVMFFREPFKLVPADKLADIADKFTRNEILSSNEVRAMIGYRPVNDPRANELRNKNLNASEENPAGSGPLAGGDEDQQSNLPSEISEMLNVKMAEQSAISHSGVKGQKWGIRNGPPYPIQRGQVQNKSLNPNVRKLSNYSGKMYCISPEKLDGQTLVPRIPDNYFTKNGYEDGETPRVCFAPSVDQCLMALSQKTTNMPFYVYSPDDMSKIDVYKPNKKAVPDSDITGELWTIQPTKLKQVGRIICQGDAGEDGLKYTYGDDKEAELYKWNYIWKEKRKN